MVVFLRSIIEYFVKIIIAVLAIAVTFCVNVLKRYNNLF
jgi:hypothetical protein